MVSLPTDDAPAMISDTKRLIAQLTETCRKQGNNLLNILITLSIKNFMVQSFKHRTCAKKISISRSEYSNLPYYTDIQWIFSQKFLFF